MTDNASQRSGMVVGDEEEEEELDGKFFELFTLWLLRQNLMVLAGDELPKECGV